MNYIAFLNDFFFPLAQSIVACLLCLIYILHNTIVNNATTLSLILLTVYLPTGRIARSPYSSYHGRLVMTAFNSS